MTKSINTLAKKNLATTHEKYSEQVKRAKVEILEMEDVLFHLNSAVMLPDKPEGKSSSQGDKDKELDKKQQKLSGLRALAIVFRQYEFDPRKKILIAAHTDTSGEVEPNFVLSDKRGKSVVSLLSGDKETWAKTCAVQHNVEDFQQIMKYFYRKRGWECNPGSIDNKCGDKTKKAAKNFFDAYRTLHDDPKRKAEFSESLPPGLHENTKWPEIAWKAVYDFYMDELCQILQIKRSHLEGMRKDRINARWVDPKRPYVACGESFPLQHPEKSNYRSQKNRRVEFLFFKDKESPEKIDCPAQIKTKHVASECPLWYDQHMTVEYVNPDYLDCAAFHLKFSYYDRIQQDFLQVPEGLHLYAYKVGDAKPLETGHDYSDGIYTIRVLNLKKNDTLYFAFSTIKSSGSPIRQWVYTKDKTATPVLVEKTADEISKLDFTARLNYYDLPPEWQSRNYFTRHDGKEEAGDSFETILKNYKPFGGKATAPDKPLVFSLDDIILVDDQFGQDINNAAGDKPQDLDHTDTKVDLSANSRVAILYLDGQKDYDIDIFKPLTSHPYFSDIKFTKNLITDRINEKGKLRFPLTAIFCSSFYLISDKRTKITPKFKFAQGHILGARAAVLNDAAIHSFSAVSANPNDGTVAADMKDYVQSWCGNYELHYVHKCGVRKSNIDGKEKPLSYLIIYWNGRYAVRSDSTAAELGANWRENHEKFGITNSMTRTNRPYLIEKKDGSADIIIRPYYYYEAKLVTKETAPAAAGGNWAIEGVGGKHKCRVEVSKVAGAWMQPALAKFHFANYQAEAGYYGSDAYVDVDGATYTPLTNHHEMGHATGLFDDYLYNAEIYKIADGSTLHTFFGLPRFSHPFTAPGGPYSLDFLARMYNNRSPRMRDYWHFINWINDESGDATNKKLKKFLDGTVFKLSYKYKKDAADKLLLLDLWDTKYRDTCKPAYETDNFGFTGGGTGKADLLLYRLGGGETANTLDPKQLDDPARVMNPRVVFDGILVVRHKLGIRFANDTHVWNLAALSTWLKQFTQKPLRDLDKFYLECSRDNDFKRIIMLFMPHYQVYNAPVPTPTADWVTAAPADSHFNLIIKANPGKAGPTLTAAGKNLTVDYDIDKTTLVKYLIGKTAAGAIDKNDFPSILTWAKNTLGLTPASGGGWFSMKDLP
ncbi:hypothetical protein TRIP_C20975 [Candidatus Zixiibacteriota bacterium]|nr:hypothetical protein TRIP_C20975 [candidate division Zixibacteria bacterium]